MADPDGVNWLLLAELVVVVIATSAFFFYWNRLFGSVLAFIIRLLAWRSNHAYVSVGSLQISPLAGRIAFRDVEYHSSNLSVRALHGHVTWRYWKLRVRQEEDAQASNSKRSQYTHAEISMSRVTLILLRPLTMSNRGLRRGSGTIRV
jgi:hypothetical protein